MGCRRYEMNFHERKEVLTWPPEIFPQIEVFRWILFSSRLKANPFAVVPTGLSLWQTLCHLPSLLLAPLARNQYLKSVLLPTSRP
jgi:hypothetical protein